MWARWIDTNQPIVLRKKKKIKKSGTLKSENRAGLLTRRPPHVDTSACLDIHNFQVQGPCYDAFPTFMPVHYICFLLPCFLFFPSGAYARISNLTIRSITPVHPDDSLTYGGPSASFFS
jgi:hypothetical protein